MLNTTTTMLFLIKLTFTMVNAPCNVVHAYVASLDRQFQGQGPRRKLREQPVAVDYCDSPQLRH
jgi:hypothetical protein